MVEPPGIEPTATIDLKVHMTKGRTGLHETARNKTKGLDTVNSTTSIFPGQGGCRC